MAGCIAARAAIVVLLAGCSTASSPVAGSASTRIPTPTEDEPPKISYTRQICDRLEVAVHAQDLREATAIARRMAASGHPSSPGDATVIDPRILVDVWALLDAYRQDDVPRYGFALGTLQKHCRKAH